MKKCVTCKEDKNEDCFTHDKSKPDGLYPTCKECLKEKRNDFIIKKKKSDYDKKYKLDNIEKVTEARKEYQKNIPNEVRAKHNRNYREKHKEEFNKKQLLYIKKNKYKFAYRTILFNFLTRSNTNKTNITSELLGYDVGKFKQRIELNFKDGMDWNNHGEWHIDHKKPISMFKEGTPANIVNALCNLQPLWAKDNLSKGNKIIKYETY
jgi:hypothetical protein